MHDDVTVTASFACMPESVTTQNDIGNLFCYQLKHTNALPNTCVLRLTGATEASNAPAHRWARLLGMCLPMAGLSCCKMRLPMARLSCCKRRLRMARLSAYGSRLRSLPAPAQRPQNAPAQRLHGTHRMRLRSLSLLQKSFFQ